METPKLPEGCGYTGNDFGASYPDSQCYGGRLYDLDNCDENGALYEPPDFIPCPECNHEAWRNTFEDQIVEQGYIAASDGKSVESCPYPETAKRYPQDGEWLKACWIRGFNQFKQE